ncbi:hypothetical protein D3C78_1319970 [compost metagenome]
MVSWFREYLMLRQIPFIIRGERKCQWRQLVKCDPDGLIFNDSYTTESLESTKALFAVYQNFGHEFTKSLIRAIGYHHDRTTILRELNAYTLTAEWYAIANNMTVPLRTMRSAHTFERVFGQRVAKVFSTGFLDKWIPLDGQMWSSQLRFAIRSKLIEAGKMQDIVHTQEAWV